jgi:hypothetical protein
VHFVLLNIPILKIVKRKLEMLMIHIFHATVFTGVLFQKMETLVWMALVLTLPHSLIWHDPSPPHAVKGPQFVTYLALR